MNTIRALIAAALITVPAFTLNAAQPMPQNATSYMSGTRPTTSQACCAYVYLYGMWICIVC